MDHSSKNIIGFQVEVKDIKHLASLEKNPRKKRLMQERQYQLHVGKGIIGKMLEGSQPEYEKPGYDSQGGEMKTKVQKK